MSRIAVKNAHWNEADWLTLTLQQLKDGGLEATEVGNTNIYMRWAAIHRCIVLSSFSFGSQVVEAKFDNLDDAQEAARRLHRDACIKMAEAALGVKE